MPNDPCHNILYDGGNDKENYIYIYICIYIYIYNTIVIRTVTHQQQFK